MRCAHPPAAISRTGPPRRPDPVTQPPFQRFLDSNRDEVWRFLVAAVGRDAADDCFQETFMAALRAYPRTRVENPRAWVLTIAHRKALDHHRARARRPAPVGALPDVPAPVAAEPAGDGVWGRVRELPPKQRAALLLRYAGDLSHREVAAALGCSEEAARRSAHEGLKRLREELAA
jgi:DNA-directed RNA polymerase specialized sigma24 family protein